MALVKCKECGAEVAESAPTCPKCGVPNPAGRTASISIARKSQLTTAPSRVDVFIDEQLAGQAEWAKTTTFDVAPGSHVLDVVCTAPAGMQFGRHAQFELTGGQAAAFECGNYGFISSFDLRRLQEEEAGVPFNLQSRIDSDTVEDPDALERATLQVMARSSGAASVVEPERASAQAAYELYAASPSEQALSAFLALLEARADLPLGARGVAALEGEYPAAVDEPEFQALMAYLESRA